MNFLEIYSHACNACGVRPNSLLLKTLREQPAQPITHLQLADNYVGPRGFLALVPIIEKCQTLEVLDLRGNGLDNSSVIALCRVLRSHLGVHSIGLSRNPISAEGGRHLLELLESNKHIVRLEVEQTDLFDAFVDRIAMAAAANEGDTDNKPIILPSRLKHGSGSSGSKKKDHHDRHTLHNDDDDSSATASTSVSVPYASQQRRVLGARQSIDSGASPSVMRKTSVSSELNVLHGASSTNALEQSSHGRGGGGGGGVRSSSQPNLTGSLRPKPPAPAIASEAYSRLTKEQRDLMKERYRQKAAVFEQVEATASHKLASDFRAELALLEGAQQRADYSRGGLHALSPARRSPSNSAESARQQQHQQTTTTAASDSKSPRPPPIMTGGSAAADADKPQLKTPTRDFFSDSTCSTALARSGETERPKRTVVGFDESGRAITEDDEELEKKKLEEIAAAAAAARRRAQMPAVLVSVPMVPVTSAHGGEGGGHGATASSAFPHSALLTPADQFRALFNQGCAYYSERNLDGAYASWNEAVHVATQERNREWLSIVQSNLQNLSFEMLTTEASQAIERGDLRDANKSLELALKLATKARNAAWEAECMRMRRTVLMSNFTMDHEAATLLLEKLVNLPTIDVNDDVRFVSPTGQLEAHTPAFVSEWTMLLVVKELLDKCVESRRSAIGVGGNNGAALAALVEGTVSTVSRHLLSRYWRAGLHDPASLAALGAGRFTRSEREALTRLWADMRGPVKELDHPLWAVVELCQYGNLLLASHELAEALSCFEKAAEHAADLSDRFLIGSSFLFCGIVQLQRSSFSVAESLFQSALTEFGEVRQGVAPLRPPKYNSSSGEGAGAPSSLRAAASVASSSSSGAVEPKFVVRDGPQPAQPVQCSVPLEDLCLFHSQAFFLLSRALIGSYRYRPALEAHERFLLYQHHDVLFEKLQTNFSPMPTTDHLRAVSASLGHALVYYAVHYRHDWDIDERGYKVTEHVYSWIVSGEGDAKFNEVDVAQECGVPSLRNLIDAARRGMYVDTATTKSPLVASTTGSVVNTATVAAVRKGGNNNNTSNNNSGIVLSLDEVAWRHPLRMLFVALMHQVIDVLSSYCAYSDLGVVTVIPHGFLWLVPFGALLDERDQFLLERMTLCHATCATQLAFSQLCVKQLMQSNNARNVVIKPPEQIVDASKADIGIDSATGGGSGSTTVSPSKAAAAGASISHASLGGPRRKSGETGLLSFEKMDTDSAETSGELNDALLAGCARRKSSSATGTGGGATTITGGADDPLARNRQLAVAAAEVLRPGITPEQMAQEADTLVKSLGNGTILLPCGTGSDMLNHIAYSNIAYICSSILHTRSTAEEQQLFSIQHQLHHHKGQSQSVAGGGAASGAASAAGDNAYSPSSYSGVGAGTVMKGGIKVTSSSFGTVDGGVLGCEDVAFANLPIETVVLPYSAMDVETASRDGVADGVMSLCRGFLGAGTVSVITSQWQCSDVFPADFLRYVNRDLQRQPNRAIALARAVRQLLHEEAAHATTIGSANDASRPLACFKPRRWAGAMLIGVPDVPRRQTQQQQQQLGGGGGGFRGGLNDYSAF